MVQYYKNCKRITTLHLLCFRTVQEITNNTRFTLGNPVHHQRTGLIEVEIYNDISVSGVITGLSDTVQQSISFLFCL